MLKSRYAARGLLLLGISLSWTAAAQTSVPRYQVFTPPATVGAQSNNGEMNLGFNPVSKRYMAMAFINGSVFRVTPPEVQSPALPESCDAKWEAKTPRATSQPQVVGDPILFTDGITGRTWVSNFTTGANYSYAYTSNDGDSWTEAGVAPPNGGADHQTIASGPYPAGSQFKAIATANGFPNAVYFCSQALAPNFCQRSDDGGRSYGPGIAFTTGVACGGLHGHARVGFDGDVHVPDKSCGGGNPGYSVSSDAGLTWKDVIMTNMTSGTEDPSIGIATDGTRYFCNVNANGHVVVSVARGKSTTWSTPVDISAAAGLNNAVFTNAIAGDPGRAACAFIGTTTPGNFSAIDFTGVWYPYIAHTYDGGATWTTVAISPNDPVQGVGGICRSGTTCMNTPDNRNLLDFNEITLDNNGRPAYGYDDGCTGACVTGPTVAPATRGAFGAQIKIARQYGGRTLFASKDANYPEPAVPNQSCLAGTRTIAQSALSWNPPDNGGSAIAGYDIFRATTQNGFGSTPIGQTSGSTTSYNDLTQDPDVATYFYKVVARNAIGTGPASNLVPLAVSQPENICLSPGLTQLTDPADDIFALSPTAPGNSNTPFYDLRSLSISQPYFADGSYKIAFHLRVTSLATVPQGANWPVNFCSPAFANCTDTNAALSATNKYYTVRMTTDPRTKLSASSSTPEFQVLAPIAADATRTTKLAVPVESTFNANGLITIVVNAVDLGLTPAGAGTESLTRFLSRINIGLTPDNMPNSLVGEGTFTTKPLSFCGPNTAPIALLTATPATGTAPLLVTLSGSNSIDADASDRIASYTFDFGDGSETITQPAATLSHTYANPGSYNATLKVRDSRGLGSSFADTKRITATAPNTAPTARLTATPSSGTAPLPVTFDASTSSDPDAGDALTYSFDLDGNGSFEIIDSGNPKPSITYNTPGSYLAQVKVKDRAGLESAVATSSITVNAPAGAAAITISSFTASPATGDVTSGPLNVSFSASATDSDSAGGALSYTFYYGDGTNSARQSSPTSSHPYPNAGKYTATVIVADENANSATAEAAITTTTTVTVVRAPSVTANLNVTLDNSSSQVPATATLDGSGSTSTDGAIYRFSFGDGTPDQVGTSKMARHVYTTAGSFTTTLTVTDKLDPDNNSTATATVTITATKQTVAQLSINPSTVKVGEFVRFDASASLAATGATIQSFSFDFGDGTAVLVQTVPTPDDGSAAIARHAYSRPGNFTPSVTVTDSKGVASISKAGVKVGTTPAPVVPTTRRFGGALPLFTLLPLLGLAALRRRRRL